MPVSIRRALVLASFVILLAAPAASDAADGPIPIETAQTVQRDYFSVFRSAPEGFPPALRKRLRPILDSHGFNLNLAQRTRPDSDAPPVWAIPGRGWVCVYTRRPGGDGGSSCGRTAVVAQNGLDLFALGSGEGEGSRTVGLVPNDVREVHLRHNPDRIPVSENTFSGRGQGLAGLIRHHFHDKVVHKPPQPFPQAPYPCPASPDGTPAYCPVPRLLSRSPGGDRLALVSGPDERFGAARAGQISANGRFAAFEARGDIFIRDLRGGRVGRLGPGASPVFSADGRSLAYEHDSKVFVRNLSSGARVLVSRLLPLTAYGPPGSSTRPSISADGRFVAFQSSKRGLVDENGDRKPDEGYSPYQVYLRDLRTKTTTLISRASGSDGAIGNGESREPEISANGRYVVFTSEATNLLPGAPRPGLGLYVRDLKTGSLRRISHWNGKPGPHPTSGSSPSISADGRFVAFDLGRVGDTAAVVVRDLRTGKTVRASQMTRNPLKLGSGAPTISANGRFVAFRALSVGVVNYDKLYLVDLHTHRTKFVHIVGAGDGGPLSLSADGSRLLFDTFVDANVPKGTEKSVAAHGGVYLYVDGRGPRG